MLLEGHSHSNTHAHLHNMKKEMYFSPGEGVCNALKTKTETHYLLRQFASGAASEGSIRDGGGQRQGMFSSAPPP